MQVQVMNEWNRLTGQTNGSDTIGGGGARSVSDQGQFSEVSAFGDAADFHFNAVLAQHADADGAHFHKVHAVRGVALSNHARVVVERSRV